MPLGNKRYVQLIKPDVALFNPQEQTLVVRAYANSAIQGRTAFCIHVAIGFNQLPLLQLPSSSVEGNIVTRFETPLRCDLSSTLPKSGSLRLFSVMPSSDSSV